jgi:hypothetical protein
VEGATLRRLRRYWVSTVTSLCALVISATLMALSDGQLPGVAPERVLNLGAGPRVDHQGAGIGTIAPVERSRPSTPAGAAPPVNTTPTTAVVPAAAPVFQIVVAPIGARLVSQPPAPAPPPADNPAPTPATKPPAKPPANKPPTNPGAGGSSGGGGSVAGGNGTGTGNGGGGGSVAGLCDGATGSPDGPKPPKVNPPKPPKSDRRKAPKFDLAKSPHKPKPAIADVVEPKAEAKTVKAKALKAAKLHVPKVTAATVSTKAEHATSKHAAKSFKLSRTAKAKLKVALQKTLNAHEAGTSTKGDAAPMLRGGHAGTHREHKHDDNNCDQSAGPSRQILRRAVIAPLPANGS